MDDRPMTDTEHPQSPVSEERRTITVLFADLVGSTALAERLDPDETRLILADAVRRVVEAVESYGGYVKDLAGDGVLAFFGAPVAHEDDAERAILTGLRIAATIDEYGVEVERAWGVDRLAVRVGVNTGPVVLGPLGGGQRVEYAAFGDAVNVAARLQAAADPGTVLVADPTRRLVDPLYAWGETRDLSLKGRDASVSASVALHALAGASRHGPAAHARLVGRERELARIAEAVERVASGTGGIVLLTGEAGIGKSRLLQELRDRFGAAASPIGPSTWFEGRCVSYGESIPYWPFREMLRDWLGVAADDAELRVRVALRRRIEELFGDRTDEIYPYLGTLLEISLEPTSLARVAELSPEALQYRTFEVVRALFTRLGERGPVAVAIDDMHWADATSIQLATSLLGATDESGLLVVIAMRTERDRAAWQFRERAASQYPHRFTELALESLGADAEHELLDELVGRGTLPDSLEKRLLGDAEGNPFFLEELVGAIVDAGALVRTDGAWRFDHEVELVVPDSVEQVILARIARLTPKARQVLTAAAVLGRHFSQPLLEHLVEADESLGQPLTELQRLDLIRENRRWPQPEYRFKHALIQESAYRTIVTATRHALHRRAAEFLEQRREEGGDAPLDLLAHHWLGAEDEEQAIRSLTLAGDRARNSWSLDEAIGHYRALLPLLERRGERQAIAIVLFKLALALHTALRFREANNAYQRAFAHWTPPQPAPAVDVTLRIGASSIGSVADPPRSYFLPDIRLQMAIFDRLVERWPEATIVPSLAEHWEISDDGLNYRFRLRDGLRWSDGTPLTAFDVEFGVRRNLDPERPAMSVGIFFVLEGAQDYHLRRHSEPERIGVHAIDDRTLEFRLAAPAPYFMSVVNRPDAGPQPRHAFERHGDAWLDPEHQVVSGAFRVATRRPDLVELERRTDAGTPRSGNTQRVVWQLLGDDELTDAYTADRVDLGEPAFTVTSSSALEADPENLLLGPPAYLVSIAFDFDDPVVGNPDVRRALASAIDREALAVEMPAPISVATGGIVPPALQGHTPDIARRFDPDLARSLLARAGITGPLRIGAARDGLQPLIEAVAESWRSVLGLPIQLELIEPATWRAADDRFDFGAITLHGWYPGYPDPEYFLRLLLQSDSRDITTRPNSRYRSEAFDALIEQARQERDGPRRLELFHSADRLAVVEDVALIPLVYARNAYLVKPWLHGWWEFGKSWTSFADLHMDRTDRHSA
jgi:ABC-type oligopeptide transport system substrate-binding subunit/class 3 adenylate cyclase